MESQRQGVTCAYSSASSSGPFILSAPFSRRDLTSGQAPVTLPVQSLVAIEMPGSEGIGATELPRGSDRIRGKGSSICRSMVARIVCTKSSIHPDFIVHVWGVEVATASRDLCGQPLSHVCILDRITSH